MRQVVATCLRSILLGWIAFTFQICLADNLLAPQQSIVRLPQPGGFVQGFVATITVADHDIAGYVPVEITLTSTARFTADRRFVLHCEPTADGRTPPRNGISSEVPIVAAQGTKSTRRIVYLPKWSAGSGYQLSLSEDGQPLVDYSSSIGSSVRRGRRVQSNLLDREYELDWIYIDAVDNHVNPTDLQLFSAAIGQSETVPTAWLAGLRTTLHPGGPMVLALGQKELPDDWRGYQRFDAVIVSQESLSRLQQQEAAFETLRHWVLNGGIVVGYDAVSPDSLAKQLNFAWTDDIKSRNAIAAVAGGFIGDIKIVEQDRRQRKTELKKYLDAYDKAESNAEGLGEAALFEAMSEFNNSMGFLDMGTSGGTGLGSEVESMRTELREINEFEQQQDQFPRYTATQWTEQVWQQSVGAGLMIGFKQDDADPSPQHWAIAETLISYRCSPMLRRGVDPLIGDRRFTRWMIPGVAQPPVYTFIGLLTVFVILVGPVAYRRTTRHGRGYLMFAIAPVLAMVTTLAMFGYGIVADGFGTIARVRQITWIDGASGDAGERVRATYFAGVRPGDGLRFPATAEVIGYPQGSGQSWEEANELTAAIIGKVTVNEDSQVFDSSFLPSRQQRQFVIHQPRSSVGVVSLKPGNKGEPPRLHSTLDFALTAVIARDNEGNYWVADRLAANDSVVGSSLMPQDASKALGKMYNAHRPISEVREARQRTNYRDEIRDLLVHANRAVGDGARLVTDGSYEQWLLENVQLSGEIPRRFFVATAQVSDDVVAVKETQLVESIRYVFGTMP